MKRSLLCLLLIASLLLGGLLPCCQATMGNADVASAEVDCHGNPLPLDGGAVEQESCKNCSHCLQPASPLPNLALLPPLLAASDEPAAVAAAAPEAMPRPPLRPPIRVRSAFA